MNLHSTLKNLRLLPLLLLADGHLVHANEVAEIWQQRDGSSLAGGLFFANYSSKIRSSNGSTTGSKIDLEDDLGMTEDDEIGRFQLTLRPWSRHRFFLSYMDMGRDGNERITEDLIFDGVVFPIDTDVKTDLEMDMYRGGYSWSALQNEQWEVAVSLGVYWIDLDMEMESADGLIQASDSTSDPFPMVGLSATRLMGERWSLRAAAEAFTIDQNNLDGDFYNLRFSAEYALTPALGLGAGYDLVSISATHTKKNDDIDYDYEGAIIYLRWLF